MARFVALMGIWDDEVFVFDVLSIKGPFFLWFSAFANRGNEIPPFARRFKCTYGRSVYPDDRYRGDFFLT